MGDGKWVEPKFFAPSVVAMAAGASIALTPLAAAKPVLRESSDGAAGVIQDLEDQGYNVEINWLTGYDTKPLDRCWVTNINNPGNFKPSPDTFATVYVDVRCPNHDYDDFSGGIGIGVGF